MNGVMLDTNERISMRFERLCETLGCDETQADIDRVFAHLVIWYLRWAGDKATDSGLFFDVSEKRLGHWAEWDEPRKFGSALHKAGYAASFAQITEECVHQGRSGFCAVTGSGEPMLKISWNSTHLRRQNAEDLVLYLPEPMRFGQVRALLSQGKAVDRSRLPDSYNAMGAESFIPAHGSNPEGYERSRPNLDPVYPSAAPPPLPPREREREEQNLKQRKHVGETDNNRGRTGKPKSREMLDIVRENKYENPLRALLAIDETERAASLWREAVEHREALPLVQYVLGSITETDAAWVAIENPAGLVYARIRGIMQKLRGKRGRASRYGNPRGGGGSGGGARAPRLKVVGGDPS